MSNIEIVQELRQLNMKFDGTDICAMDLAYDVAHKYSSCRLCGVGKGVGALIVRNGIILSFGYSVITGWSRESGLVRQKPASGSQENLHMELGEMSVMGTARKNVRF